MKQPILIQGALRNIIRPARAHTNYLMQSMCVFEQFQLAPHLSALSEEAQMPLHHMQLPVVLLQASGVESRAQGSDGTDRVRTLPRVTPLKPPDRKRRPSQLVMARDTERFTGSPIAEAGRFFLRKEF